MDEQHERRHQSRAEARDRLADYQRRWNDIQQRRESERIREEWHDATAVTVKVEPQKGEQ